MSRSNSCPQLNKRRHSALFSANYFYSQNALSSRIAILHEIMIILRNEKLLDYNKLPNKYYNL